MKKLIAILTVMIVLVGSVFAVNQEGSAAINITATIDQELPTFQLNIKSDETATEGKPAVSVGDDAATTAFTSASVNSLKGGTDVEVHFEITQTHDARLGENSAKHIYHFSVAATNLVLQNAQGTGDAATQNDNTRFEVVDGTPDINSLSTNATTASDITVRKDTQHGETTITTATVEAGTVTYKGGLVPTSTVLGNFIVGWHGNAGAAPGTYKATVTLTVTSE